MGLKDFTLAIAGDKLSILYDSQLGHLVLLVKLQGCIQNNIDFELVGGQFAEGTEPSRIG